MDILGSLAEIAGLSALAFLGAPPVAWGAIVAGVCPAALLVLREGRSHGGCARIAGAARARVPHGGRGLVAVLAGWSPYYKIRLFPMRQGAVGLTINGVPHQIIESPSMRRKYEPIYFAPYARLRDNPLRNVMVIGAGDGGDAAIASSAGARHADAVEIDPRIYQIGYALNPDRPYRGVDA